MGLVFLFLIPANTRVEQGDPFVPFAVKFEPRQHIVGPCQALFHHVEAQLPWYAQTLANLGSTRARGRTKVVCPAKGIERFRRVKLER
jgi:hypothetical protein